MATLSIHEFVNVPQEAQDTQKVEICALGNPLTDCPARRVAGCHSHFELLHYMYPPLRVLAHVQDTMGNDPDARKWIARLDAILPGQRPGKGGR